MSKAHETCGDCKRPVLRRQLTLPEMNAHLDGSRKVCVCGFRRFIEKLVEGQTVEGGEIHVWPGYEEDEEHRP